MHSCSKECESKGVWFYDRFGAPNPYSMYGNIGSYHAYLYHCPVCGKYWSKKYDTYGEHKLCDVEVADMWTGEVKGIIKDDRPGTPPEWELVRIPFFEDAYRIKKAVSDGKEE
jgi:hypothetical protein